MLTALGGMEGVWPHLLAPCASPAWRVASALQTPTPTPAELMYSHLALQPPTFAHAVPTSHSAFPFPPLHTSVSVTRFLGTGDWLTPSFISARSIGWALAAQEAMEQGGTGERERGPGIVGEVGLCPV